METERTLLIADLSGYTALTETHGAMHASEIVLRLASRARGGQILCTAPVAAEAAGHPGVEVKLLGEQRFKNVSNPVMVYEFARVSRVAPFIDPVCRMRVEAVHAKVTIPYRGETYHFCSHECAGLFGEAPERYARLWG